MTPLNLIQNRKASADRALFVLTKPEIHTLALVILLHLALSTLCRGMSPQELRSSPTLYDK